MYYILGGGGGRGDDEGDGPERRAGARRELGEGQLPDNQTNCLFVQVMRALVLNSNETAKAKAIFKDLFFLFVFEFSFLSPRIQSLCLPLNVALS